MDTIWYVWLLLGLVVVLIISNVISLAFVFRLNKLKASLSTQEYLPYIVHQTKDGQLLAESSGKILWSNQALQHITGYPIEHFDRLLDFFRKVFLKDFRKEITNVYQKILSGSVSFNNIVTHIQDRNGVTKVIVLECKKLSYSHHNYGIYVNFRDITEEYRLQSLLQNSKERIQHYLDIVPTILLVLDVKGHILLVNRRACQVLEYKEVELLGKNWIHSFIPAEHQDAAKKVFNSVIDKKSNNIDYYENPLITRSGKKRLIAWHNNYVIDTESKKINSIIAAGEDITERKLAEQALRESEERYQQAFEIKQVIKLLVDPETGRILQANTAASQFYGYPIDILCQMYIFDFNILNERELLEQMQLAKTEQRYYFHFKHRLASGLLKDVEVYSGPIKTSKGTYLYSIIHDISDRKKIEQALLDSEQRFRNTFEQAAVGIAHLTPTSSYIKVNKKLCDITGYSREELLELKFKDILHPEDIVSYKDFFRQLITGEINDYVAEKRFICRDKHIIWVNLTISLVKERYSPKYFIVVVEDVHQRKLAEEALVKERSLLSQIMDTNVVAILRLNQSGRIIYANPGAEEIFAESAEKIKQYLYGDSSWYITNWYGVPIPEENLPFNKIRVTQRPITQVEHAVNLPDDTRILLSINGAPLFDHQGNIREIVLILEDITGRRLAEEALLASEERFRGAFEAAAHGMALVSKQGDFIRVNQALCNILGYSASELLALDFQSISHPEDLAIDLDKLQQLLNGIIPFYQIEKRYIHKQNYEIWGLLSVSIVQDRSQQPLYFVFQIQDITKQKQHQSKLLEQQERLRSLNELAAQPNLDLSAQLYNAIHLGSVHLDTEVGILIRIDEDQCEVLKCIDPYSIFFENQKVDLRTYCDNMDINSKEVIFVNNIHTAKQIGNLNFNNDFEYQCYIGAPLEVKDKLFGILIFLSAYKRQHPFQEMDIEFIRLLSRWVGSRLEQYFVSEDLRLAKEAAEAANYAKSVFLANMSHELRTPLNAILGFTQVLRKENNTNPEKYRERLSIIQDSGRHLLNLINDILDITKIEANKQELILTQFNFEDFLSTLVKIVQPKVQEKKLVLTEHYADSLPEYIEADEKRLRQVLLNLLSNAIKFTELGTITFSIDCDYSVDDQNTMKTVTLFFKVEDTGIGIPEEKLNVIFKPFEQVSDNFGYRNQGIGLGLAISQQLLVMMGSELKVISQVNVGSTFFFDLELNHISHDIASDYSETNILGYEGEACSVLVVDDNSGNRLFLKDLLEQLGFSVSVAEDGLKALEQVKNHSINLILMDIYMPNMDGYQATQALRKMEEGKDIPIIAISASMEDMRNPAYSEGFSALLLKPVDIEELLREMQKVLDIKWLYNKVEQSNTTAQDIDLYFPAPEELLILRDLVELGKMRKITDWADDLVNKDIRYEEFSDKVKTLANNMDEQGLNNLLNSIDGL